MENPFKRSKSPFVFPEIKDFEVGKFIVGTSYLSKHKMNWTTIGIDKIL